MSVEKAAHCVVRGRAFEGTYEVTGTGPSEAVQVHYKTGKVTARTGGLPIDVVASTLLANLVGWDTEAGRLGGRQPRTLR